MTLSTRLRVASRTFAAPLITRETVPTPTPDVSATSAIVNRPDRRIGVSPAWNRFHLEPVPYGNIYHSLNQMNQCRQDQPPVQLRPVEHLSNSFSRLPSKQARETPPGRRGPHEVKPPHDCDRVQLSRRRDRHRGGRPRADQPLDASPPEPSGRGHEHRQAAALWAGAPPAAPTPPTRAPRSHRAAAPSTGSPPPRFFPPSPGEPVPAL